MISNVRISTIEGNYREGQNHWRRNAANQRAEQRRPSALDDGVVLNLCVSCCGVKISVPALKAKLAEQLKVAVDRMRVIHKGRVMHNDKDINFYGLFALLMFCYMESGAAMHVLDCSCPCYALSACVACAGVEDQEALHVVIRRPSITEGKHTTHT